MRLLLACSVLGGAACAQQEPGEEILLENSSERGKADSVHGKRLVVTVTEDRLITDGSEGCSKRGDEPWVCGANTGWGEIDVFVEGDTAALRGTRFTPVLDESFYLFEARHEGFGLPNYRFVKYGQILYARERGAAAPWTLLACPGANYWPGRVLIDLENRTIRSGDRDAAFDLAECGAPAGDLEVSSFAFPISRWFSLEDRYDYDLFVNKN